MNATGWLEAEATGQQYMTANRLASFKAEHPDRWQAARNLVPEVVILDRPYVLRLIAGTGRSWAEPARFRHLAPWPPSFGDAYATGECDPNIFAVLIQGGRVEEGPSRVVVSAVYQNREVAASFPCEPPLLARCAADTLDSLRGRRVNEIPEEELLGDQRGI